MLPSISRCGRAATVALLLCSATSLAHPSGPLFRIDGPYVPIGLDLGGTFYNGRSLVYGSEFSIVDLKDGAWGGLVGSVLRDADRGVGGALALEAGLGPLGIEAGYTMRLDGEHGPRLRVVFPLLVITPYVGLDAAGPIRGTYGVLLKFPFARF